MSSRSGPPTVTGDRVDVTNRTKTAGAPPSPPPSAPSTPSRTGPSTPEPQLATKEEVNPSSLIIAAPATPPTSPQVKSSAPIAEEKQLSASERREKIARLKTRLGLDSGQCGSLTLEGAPCRWAVAKEKNEKLDSKVESMLNLTQSSPDLFVQLERLVALVCCHNHEYGRSKFSRIEQWIAAFPLGGSGVKASLPLEVQVQSAIEWWSPQCIGTAKTGIRCKAKTGGQKVHNCRLAIAEIVKSGAHWEDCKHDLYIELLDFNMRCHWHAEQRSLERTALWKGKIQAILQKAALNVANSATQALSDDAINKIGAETPRSVGLSGSEVVSTPAPSDAEEPAKPLSPRPASRRDLANHWPNLHDTSPFTIIEREKGFGDSQTSNTTLTTIVPSHRKGDDGKPGYIYLYEVDGNPGFVKLGYTTRPITDRHEEWEFDCNRKVKPLYPTRHGLVKKVANACRVEALCHEELRHCRTLIYCNNCMKPHIEWFEIPSEKAIAVIEKWSQGKDGQNTPS